ncbi:3-ketoacyl-ACP reductase [Prauserella sp. PE36]|uniref:SDR family oxidoreductase n=1 Tax=Prauserella endophytica TaxID=1592324 RepID=A0ABY2RV46_9PSEU|nr:MULTISPECIES: SDR family oxidoreductase [Prauserella]RBM18827.1 3-ketoacyl-ACP reductase [Prauserella sp. PE36]TKG61827.1 SDR family oxidoreductase [Prauserella endophytica]
MTVLDGKGAVVTGGSRGIGRSIVERLARDGAAVVFNYASNTQAAKTVEEAVRSAGGRAVSVQADLAEAGAVDRLMAVADEELDGLDIVIHSAALDIATAPISETSELVWDQTMTVNAKTAFLLTQHAARTMRTGGRIVHISTLNTSRPAPGNSAYVASKGAIEQLTRVAALELGARQITVNAVCPGATDTELLRRANPEAALAQVAAMTPLGRLGQPHDIADAVAMLASPDSRWITGQIINVTGGLG